ncbi:unnamed product [Ostreococcus tauri]|uniref:Unnamed product n=1 Tax=Ostreococcus tauri TaxID=70448 RepID=Q00UV0_OSTTA|nr:unnamed product [Ostreococcus tauri]CAL57677.1 unnamed product [Ostreococcus tauri]|eukprot:XP_003083401.1 unnamed product [Ostreococcus tauri]
MELDVSAVGNLGECVEAYRRAERVGDGALATIPRLYALCMDVQEVKLGEATRAATEAAMSERLRAFLQNGFAHPSERRAAPEQLTSAINVVASSLRAMETAVKSASEALKEFIEATSGKQSDGDASWIADVPVPVLLTAFALDGDNANENNGAYTVEQWLWICTSVVDQLEKDLETKRKIVSYLRSGELASDELSGVAATWSAHPHVDDRLLDLARGAAESS